MLVAGVHIESGDIGQQTVFPKREVHTCLVIPGIFGLVAGCFTYFRYLLFDGVHINHQVYHLQVLVRSDGVYHRIAQYAGNQVGEHLYVVSPRTVSSGSGGIYIISFAPLVLQGEFGQQLYVVRRLLSLIGCIASQRRGVLNDDRERHTWFVDRHLEVEIGRSRGRIIVHPYLFIIQTQADCSGQSFCQQVVEGGLVEDGSA